MCSYAIQKNNNKLERGKESKNKVKRYLIIQYSPQKYIEELCLHGLPHKREIPSKEYKAHKNK